MLRERFQDQQIPAQTSKLIIGAETLDLIQASRDDEMGIILQRKGIAVNMISPNCHFVHKNHRCPKVFSAYLL